MSWKRSKPNTCCYIIDLPNEKVFGHGEEISIPACVKAADYEFEVACVITKTALITDEKEALEFFKKHCYLTIVNDWSSRDIQKKDMEGLGPANSKSVIGKSFGPKLLPAAEFEMDENGVMNLEMVLTVNGEERNRTNYNTLYHTHPISGKKNAWSFPRIMAWLGQQNITVHAGYVIGSGTVGSGCIAEFAAKLDPKNGDTVQAAKYPWLTDGDTVRMEIERIGVLENKVRVANLAKAR